MKLSEKRARDKMKKRIKEPTQDHMNLHRDLAMTLKAYPQLDQLDYLCVVAQMLGQLVAYQDGSKYTTEAIMAMVELNIQTGNQLAVKAVAQMDTAGSC